MPCFIDQVGFAACRGPSSFRRLKADNRASQFSDQSHKTEAKCNIGRFTCGGDIRDGHFDGRVVQPRWTASYAAKTLWSSAKPGT